jgi:cyclophilin family peptidyl-prolyl cis-trans isomerase/putative hemolysin
MDPKKSVLVILPTIAVFAAVALLAKYWPYGEKQALSDERLSKEQVLGEEEEKTQLANPASVYCEEQGGVVDMRSGAGGQAGVCVFENGAECDEWDFYKRKCFPTPPKVTVDKEATYSATLKTSKGDISLDLFVDTNPITVNNFVFLASRGFYDGVSFHRIIKDFMVQTGDPEGTGSGGPGYRFEDEFPVVKNYYRGRLAMANAGPDTNGSQFFIVTKDNETLPKNYVIFGEITEGFSVLDAIAGTPVTASLTGEKSKPINPPVIESVTVFEEGVELNNRTF